MYKIAPITYNEPMVFIEITGDMNDGDYITEKTSLTKEQFDEICPDLIRFLQIVSIDKHAGHYRHSRMPMELRDEWDELCEWLPDTVNIPRDNYEYEFCHSLALESLTLVDTDGKQYAILLTI